MEELIPKPSKAKLFTKLVIIPQGDYSELVAGDAASFNQITTCTAVYVRSNSGRVVIYHWPFTALTAGSKSDMDAAVTSIGAKNNVALIKLFTKSDVGLQEFIEYLQRYTNNIETAMVDDKTEPIVLFNGERLV